MKIYIRVTYYIACITISIAIGIGCRLIYEHRDGGIIEKKVKLKSLSISKHNLLKQASQWPSSQNIKSLFEIYNLNEMLQINPATPEEYDFIAYCKGNDNIVSLINYLFETKTDSISPRYWFFALSKSKWRTVLIKKLISCAADHNKLLNAQSHLRININELWNFLKINKSQIDFLESASPEVALYFRTHFEDEGDKDIIEEICNSIGNKNVFAIFALSHHFSIEEFTNLLNNSSYIKSNQRDLIDLLTKKVDVINTESDFLYLFEWVSQKAPYEISQKQDIKLHMAKLIMNKWEGVAEKLIAAEPLSTKRELLEVELLRQKFEHSWIEGIQWLQETFGIDENGYALNDLTYRWVDSDIYSATNYLLTRDPEDAAVKSIVRAIVMAISSKGFPKERYFELPETYREKVKIPDMFKEKLFR